MNSPGERLEYLINTQEVIVLKFCKKNGFSYQSINPIINNHREIGINIIRDLIKVFPDLNINWLLYGRGKWMTSLNCNAFNFECNAVIILLQFFVINI